MARYYNWMIALLSNNGHPSRVRASSADVFNWIKSLSNTALQSRYGKRIAHLPGQGSDPAKSCLQSIRRMVSPPGEHARLGNMGEDSASTNARSRCLRLDRRVIGYLTVS